LAAIGIGIERPPNFKIKYQTGFTGSCGYNGLRPKGIWPQAKKIFNPLNFEEQPAL
jgi:hypothetical protein